METWRHNEVVFEGRIIRVRAGEVSLDNGEPAYREVIEHPGGVCVIPCTGESVLLVRQFRIALGRYLLEAPAGKLEGAEETLYRGECELEEETGYRAGRMVPAGSVYSTVGYCSEKVHLYLAFDLIKTAPRPDSEERIEVVELGLAEARQMLRDHAFEDGKTVVGLHALFDYLQDPA